MVDLTRWIRVLVFATIYFFIFVISAVSFMLKSYSEVQPAELTWYLQHPWIASRAILRELIQSPLLMLSLFLMILYSFVLGFVTDWVMGILKRYILLRKRKRETQFYQTKTQQN